MFFAEKEVTGVKFTKTEGALDETAEFELTKRQVIDGCEYNNGHYNCRTPIKVLATKDGNKPLKEVNVNWILRFKDIPVDPRAPTCDEDADGHTDCHTFDGDNSRLYVCADETCGKGMPTKAVLEFDQGAAITVKHVITDEDLKKTMTLDKYSVKLDAKDQIDDLLNETVTMTQEIGFAVYQITLSTQKGYDAGVLTIMSEIKKPT